MALTIKIGKTNKRINSTSQSFSSSNTFNNVYLKEDCSIDNPVFIIQGTPEKYNYCEWSGRYYWIDETIITDWKHYEVHCHLDPLATYKSSIMGSSVYAVYANSSNWNELVDDTRIQPEKLLYEYTAVKNQVFGANMISNNGCVVMTFFSAVGSYGVNPGVHTAVMTVGNFRECLKDISSIQWDEGITEFYELFAKTIQAFAGNGSWCDNIYSAFWLPINPGSITGEGVNGHTGITIGGLLADNISWKEVNQNLVIKNDDSGNIIDLSALWSTVAPTGGKAFLRNPRFTSMQLSTPSGVVGIDCSSLTQMTKLRIVATLAVTTGDWAVKIMNNDLNGEVIGMCSGNMAVDLMGLVVDSPDLMSQVAQTAFNASLGAAVVATTAEFGVNTGINGGNLVASPMIHQAPTIPIKGSCASMFLGSSPAEIKFISVTMGPQDIDNYTSFCNKYGYPCNKYISLSGYSGYLQCYNTSVSANGANDKDKQFINMCMNNGIYIE